MPLFVKGRRLIMSIKLNNVNNWCKIFQKIGTAMFIVSAVPYHKYFVSQFINLTKIYVSVIIIVNLQLVKWILSNLKLSKYQKLKICKWRMSPFFFFRVVSNVEIWPLLLDHSKIQTNIFLLFKETLIATLPANGITFVYKIEVILGSILLIYSILWRAIRPIRMGWNHV